MFHPEAVAPRSNKTAIAKAKYEVRFLLPQNLAY